MSDTGVHRFQRRGFSLEKLIRWFFASNAGLTIVILVLIIVFLLKEGLGFFPGYRRELEIYRTAGLEYVDLSRQSLTAHEQLASLLNRAYYAEINGKSHLELRRSLEASAAYNVYLEETGPTRDLIVNHPSGEARQRLESLHASFEQHRHKALAKLPPTPHLSPTERAALIASLRNRPIAEENDPPLVSELAAALAAAQQRHAVPLQDFRQLIDDFDGAAAPLAELVAAMSEMVTATKEIVQSADILNREHEALLQSAANTKDPAERARLLEEAQAALAQQPDVTTTLTELRAHQPEILRIHRDLHAAAAAMLANLPPGLAEADAHRLLRAARKAGPAYLGQLTAAPELITRWDPQQPVPLSAAVRSFLTGKDWLTGGEWQDFYGILPLAVGSLMIAMVALGFAIPLGIGAAVYVNQFAAPREQAWIKPIIEFIQAIPSVVLGFIGILVFGTLLRDVSMWDSLRWVPGFPLDERLNIFTAGCLLALMSIPTIFSLAEDALNNVPGAYAEASEALGASRLQTAFRVMIPAASSGILAAVLLGFGRVIGETMVVLLVAGNRIKIPDFSAGIGAFFQPAHTMTGIIAQELGEVPLGSVHYRALFVVGILLFAVVLGINATAHYFVSRTRR